MKKLLLFLFVVILTACSKEFDLDQFPQEWKLVSMSTSQVTPAVITGTDMEWQETYTLKSNGTFTKTRNRDGNITDASGTFLFKDSSGNKYFELTFETGISIISSCSQGKEILWVRSESKMQGTWSSCDGIGLVYERTK